MPHNPVVSQSVIIQGCRAGRKQRLVAEHAPVCFGSVRCPQARDFGVGGVGVRP